MQAFSFVTCLTPCQSICLLLLHTTASVQTSTVIIHAHALTVSAPLDSNSSNFLEACWFQGIVFRLYTLIPPVLVGARTRPSSFRRTCQECWATSAEVDEA